MRWVALALFASLLTPAPALAESVTSNPAGGAETKEAVIATALALAIMGAMAALVAGHLTGRVRILARVAQGASRISGLPGWAAFPSDILGGALLIALFGMYWDISLHIDNGRDPGPLANPAHYFILFGLFGVFFAGILAIVLAKDQPTQTSVRLPNGWHAPLGGLVIAFCGAIALLAFPLDDTWHRIFGQDVTLWGPTHLLLIGGASFATLGLWILITEGRRVTMDEAPENRAAAIWARLGELVVPGALLVGLSTFQAEFDFGLPQWRLVLEPMLIMLAAGIALVAARVRSGPGGAIFAVGLFLAVRGGIALLVGPAIGQTTPQFPLFIAEALIVELLALRLSTDQPFRFGAIAGLAIGTAGLAAEWAWSHVWLPNGWPEAMLLETALLALPVAIAAGVIGGFIGASLRERPLLQGAPRTAVVASALGLIGVFAWALQMPSPDPAPTANVRVTELPGSDDRRVLADIRLTPEGAAEDAHLLNLSAWQGGELIIDRLREVGPGHYRTTKPIPVSGSWKAMLQIQKDRAVIGMPVYMPDDPAIPAPEVPAPAQFSRSFIESKEVFQREQKPDVPAGLSVIGYLAVLGLWGSMFGALALGLQRVGRRGGSDGGATPTRPSRKAGAPALGAST